MTTTWTDADLAHFGDAEEVRIAGMRQDGSLRKPVIVWVARVGDELYTRSVNGRTRRGSAVFRFATAGSSRLTARKLMSTSSAMTASTKAKSTPPTTAGRSLRLATTRRSEHWGSRP